MAIVGIILLFALVIFIRLKMPMWKGKYSEKLVNDKISKLSDEYVIFNDLLFESNGRSTQIDHVIVSPYGVFVIETKGYKGWILGGENSEYWTQTIYQSKHQFYNPIKQNEGHVRFLRYLLKCSVEIPFIPIVVFNNAADLKVYIENHIVINRCNLIHAISQYKTPVLDKTTVDWIVKTIRQNHIIANKEDLKRHKHNAKSQQYKSQNLINQGVCPRCGGQLILRQGKFGSFYGCSNYPKCKFTLNS
ncbi:NERD domain-containing protein [Alistipes finegoldii]|uniref:NERD domain-containing protein n=1 Tax=Alistipes finegoldii TaxID=214856 RepID=A0AAE4RWJ0_9BACT|nr:NERD domain-containing protein [Alistipes finegoldii]MDU0259394.1 NERD domain-containing protein [Alistipes finegoldii]